MSELPSKRIEQIAREIARDRNYNPSEYWLRDHWIDYAAEAIIVFLDDETDTKD